MAVRVKCIAYFDDFKEEQWPVEMAARPIKGDLVQSKDGRLLTVSSITHTPDYSRSETEPIMEVLLTK